MEFAKIPMPESLKNFDKYFLKNKHMSILKILIEFNAKFIKFS